LDGIHGETGSEGLWDVRVFEEMFEFLKRLEVDADGLEVNHERG
jgi:hypothetical protein